MDPVEQWKVEVEGVTGPLKIGQEERSESGQDLRFFDRHLGSIRTGFAKIFKTANDVVRTSFESFG